MLSTDVEYQSII